jgi:hypothetical protein
MREAAATFEEVLGALHSAAASKLTSPEDRQAFVRDLVAALEQRDLVRTGPPGAGAPPSADTAGRYGEEIERVAKANKAKAITKAVGSAFRAR